MLQIIDLDYPKKFKKKFKNLNVEVPVGSFCYLLYSDSNEKGHFMDILYRQNQLKKGKVLIDGEDINRLSKTQFAAMRRELSVVYSDFKLISSKSVYGNLIYVSELSAAKTALNEANLDRLLDFFGLLHKKYDYPESLSKREKRLLSIVRAVIRGGELFILEDASKFLDESDCEKLMLFLEKLNKRGKTVFFITEDASLPKKYPNKVFKLQKGAII